MSENASTMHARLRIDVYATDLDEIVEAIESAVEEEAL
jgi:hypothetical protein